MTKEPEFCIYCGHPMWLAKTKSWGALFMCTNGHSANVTYGDQMSGAEYCYVDWSES